MRLTINGETHEVAAADIRTLLAELNYEGTFVAVAVNHAVVPRSRWAEAALAEGDQVEIVSPRQGG